VLARLDPQATDLLVEARFGLSGLSKSEALDLVELVHQDASAPEAAPTRVSDGLRRQSPACSAYRRAAAYVSR
jgi:hypothetical protein